MQEAEEPRLHQELLHWLSSPKTRRVPLACRLSTNLLGRFYLPLLGPRLPNCGAAAIGGYLGYTGRGANAFWEAARDPSRRSFPSRVPRRTTHR